MTLLFVSAGEFTMGSDVSNRADENPAHKIYLEAFWIDQTEVTNKMYADCVAAGGCESHNNNISFNRRSGYYSLEKYADYPVIYVQWGQALKYCQWVGRRLPTEAEWEKAARGADGNLYPWGNSAPDESLLNYNGNNGDTTKVGSYPKGASPYGALDMAGNVWEWVSSLYKPYPYDAKDGREDLSASGQRVLRGGTWVYSDGDNTVRSAYRFKYAPDSGHLNVGFRCAVSAE